MNARAMVTMILALGLAPGAGATPPDEAPVEAVEASVEGAKGEDRARLVLRASELRRLAGDAEAARRWLDRLTGEVPPRSPGGQAARLGLALLDIERDGISDAAVQVLVATPERHLLPSQNAARFGWLALWARQQGQDEQRFAAKALELATPGQRAGLAALLADTAEAPPGETGAKAGKPPRLSARDALAAGRYDRARELATEARGVATTPDEIALADRLLRVTAGPPVVPGKVGVLLPLSGRYGAVGRQVQEALVTGWGDATGELIVRDSGGEPDTAVAALEALATEGVVAVLGPLLTAEAEVVADVAEALGVPLVVLAQGFEPSPSRGFVFQGWVTPRQQVEVLLDHAFGERDLTTFAVLAPGSDYGRAAADAFVAGVERRGGVVALRRDYDIESSDFRMLAREIARRPREDEPPVVDYQAVFVPDNARRVALVAAALAYEEIPVGTFRPHDTPSVPLLGLSGWNDHELVPGGGIYTQRGMFTDIFVAPPTTAYAWYAPDSWRTFVDDFRTATGRTPSPVEALAADAARALAAALASGPTTRADALAALPAVDPGGSPTGVGRFDPATGTLTHEIRILSVAKDGFVPVEQD